MNPAMTGIATSGRPKPEIPFTNDPAARAINIIRRESAVINLSYLNIDIETQKGER